MRDLAQVSNIFRVFNQIPTNGKVGASGDGVLRISVFIVSIIRPEGGKFQK